MVGLHAHETVQGCLRSQHANGICMYVCMHVCMYVCICLYLYVFMYGLYYLRTEGLNQPAPESENVILTS